MLINKLGYYFGSLEGLMAFLIMVFCLSLSLSLHELAHGYAAYKLGDDTAKYMGRLSLSPFKHLDLLGTLSMLFFGIGWAVPVPINYYNFKNVTQRAGILITSISGPFVNFILAFVAVLFLEITKIYLINSSLLFAVMQLFEDLAIINVSFGLFNLIPVPPLDGAKIFRAIANADNTSSYFMEKFGIFLIILLFQMPAFKALFGICIERIISFYYFLINLMPFFARMG